MRPCPTDSELEVINWRNERLRFRPDKRLTPAQRREILRRDGYCCSTPGCPNRLWLAAHHVIYFVRGGPSLPSNLIVLCSSCHRNLHRGWLRVAGLAPEDRLWADGRGTRLVRARLLSEDVLLMLLALAEERLVLCST